MPPTTTASHTPIASFNRYSVKSPMAMRPLEILRTMTQYAASRGEITAGITTTRDRATAVVAYRFHCPQQRSLRLPEHPPSPIIGLLMKVIHRAITMMPQAQRHQNILSHQAAVCRHLLRPNHRQDFHHGLPHQTRRTKRIFTIPATIPMEISYLSALIQRLLPMELALV